MPIQHLIETKQKALEINLDTAIYGAFAEIGAGDQIQLAVAVDVKVRVVIPTRSGQEAHEDRTKVPIG